jgi:hypothetical protein
MFDAKPIAGERFEHKRTFKTATNLQDHCFGGGRNFVKLTRFSQYESQCDAINPQKTWLLKSISTEP